jgi:lactose/L-arabinose transport system ATP-binding protein
MSNLSLKNLRKSYGPVEVIKGVDLDITPGEFVVFVGPSGCGKSTLLRMIAGLEQVTSGTIEITDRDVTDLEPYDRGIAMVFQSYALYPHMTVAENMGFALRLAGQSKADRRKVVEEAARILQIEHLLDRKPAQLSGGQRQRVAIGRSIVREPDVFLFDEPLSNLDAELRVKTRIEIARLHQTLDTTMIYVTHDQTEAMTLADRIVVLRGGIIEQVGAPTELYDDPDNAFVAGFIGSPAMNFMPCTVLSETEIKVAGITIAMPQLKSTLTVGDTLKMGIRPEHLNGTNGPSLEMKIDVVEQLGATAFVHGKIGTDTALLVEARASRPKAGDMITVPFDPQFIYLFAKDGARIR